MLCKEVLQLLSSLQSVLLFFRAAITNLHALQRGVAAAEQLAVRAAVLQSSYY